MVTPQTLYNITRDYRAGTRRTVSVASPFSYLNLSDPTFCRLLEQSAQIAAATDAVDDLAGFEAAILGRISSFAPHMVANIASISETALEGVYRLDMDTRPVRDTFQMMDTSGTIKTVGSYTLRADGGFSQHVRIVR